MIDIEKDEQKRLNAIKFIQVTEKLMEEGGYQSVSIRKIAKEADFHSSTIYLYFKDVNQLILLASMKYFKEYEKALEAYSTKNVTDPFTYFLDIWNMFMDSAFKYPSSFYNFFFGKYSDQLDSVIELYYKILPGEKRRYSGIIQEMFAGRNLHERNRSTMLPLAGQPDFFPEEKLDLINDIIISCFRDLLHQRTLVPTDQADIPALKQKMRNILIHVTTKQ